VLRRPSALHLQHRCWRTLAVSRPSLLHRSFLTSLYGGFPYFIRTHVTVGILVDHLSLHPDLPFGLWPVVVVVSWVAGGRVWCFEVSHLLLGDQSASRFSFPLLACCS
jgi:hypothetical protein